MFETGNKKKELKKWINTINAFGVLCGFILMKIYGEYVCKKIFLFVLLANTNWLWSIIV